MVTVMVTVVAPGDTKRSHRVQDGVRLMMTERLTDKVTLIRTKFHHLMGFQRNQVLRVEDLLVRVAMYGLLNVVDA